MGPDGVTRAPALPLLLILLPSHMRRMSSSTAHSITTWCLTGAQKLRSSWLRKNASKTVSQNTPFFLRWLAQIFCFPNGRLVDTPLPVKCDSLWLSPKLLLITRFITRIGVLPSSLPLPLTTYLSARATTPMKSHQHGYSGRICTRHANHGKRKVNEASILMIRLEIIYICVCVFVCVYVYIYNTYN